MLILVAVPLALALLAALAILGYYRWPGAGAPVPADRFPSSPIEDAALPTTAARIVGIGEATHGNVEFHHARQRMFSQLVDKHGFRTFALEADAGGAAAVDRYITTGEGTAEEAVRKIGFRIYQVRDMGEMVTWMRDANTSRTGADQIRFAGFDFQRYDENKRALMRLLDEADEKTAGRAERDLADATDAGFADLDEGAMDGLAVAAEKLRDDIAAHRAAWTKKVGATAYEDGLHYATVIAQGARWRADDASSEMRDALMAENVAWLVEHRAGSGGMMIAGHNGHIARTGNGIYRPMGSHLADRFGADYYAIGSEFKHSRFLVASRAGEAEFSVTNHRSGAWDDLFGGKAGFVDFTEAGRDPAVATFLGEPRGMSMVNNEFLPVYAYVPFFYTWEMAPDALYDALVYVPDVTPSTLVP